MGRIKVQVRSFQLCVYLSDMSIANISMHVLRQLCASHLEEPHPHNDQPVIVIA
jgi:hypothetical protein